MKHCTLIIVLGAAWMAAAPAAGQDSASVWTLERCMRHARENSLEVRQNQLSIESAGEDLRQAKAAFAPSVSASTSQNFSYSPVLDNPSFGYSANYSIGLSMTLVDGGKMYFTKKQAQLNQACKEQGLLTTRKEMDMSILQAYLQALYSREAINTAERGVELDKEALDRANILFAAGKITKADRAQVESQYSQSRADLISAGNNLQSALLTLKQLLELPIDNDFRIDYPDISDAEVMTPLPDMMDVYRRAMETMPQVKEAEMEKEYARLGVKAARSGWYPTLSFSASAGGSYNTLQEPSLGDQFKSNFGPSAGFTLSIPIYDRSQTRAAVNKAEISERQADLGVQQAEKTISKYVESLYIDAKSAQANFQAALDKLAYAEESYKLVSEQFRVGLKNTVEMLTERQNLISAEQSLSQSRYQTVISIQLLNLLRDEPVSIGQ